MSAGATSHRCGGKRRASGEPEPPDNLARLFPAIGADAGLLTGLAKVTVFCWVQSTLFLITKPSLPFRIIPKYAIHPIRSSVNRSPHSEFRYGRNVHPECRCRPA